MHRINYAKLVFSIFILFHSNHICFALPGMPSNPLGIFSANPFSELSEIKDNPSLLSLSSSTLSLFHKGYLVPTSKNTFMIKASLLDAWDLSLSNGQTFNAPLCPEVSITNQPSAAYCSAALIAPHLAMTSGHCVQTLVMCEDLKLVFGFNDLNLNFRAKTGPLLVTKDEVFSCKKVLFQTFSLDLDAPDIAIIELDRPVPLEKHKPIALDNTLPQINDPVISFGSPLGVPTKLSKVATVLGVEKNYITANLNALSCSSGGVVINLNNGKAIGVVSKGEADIDTNGREIPFVYDSERNCATWNILNNPSFWARVTPISAIPDKYLKP